jgi:3-oxoacyl-[acyl-carrier protein] reductase
VIPLAGARALVTGGGRGIGRATALLLCRAGAQVAVGYRSRDADARETVRLLEQEGGRAVAVAGDLGEPESAKRVVSQVVEALGGLELLIVNHGVWPPADRALAEMPDSQWRETREANLDSVFFVCRAAIPSLPHGGRIVLVSSTAGQRGEAFHADYAATKGAILALTKSLAVELAPHINVNCVAPGWTSRGRLSSSAQRGPDTSPGRFST